MYLNLYQKYILELLDEYGGLLKRQLEFMVKRFKEPYLRDINGYVYQLRRFEKVYCADYMGEEAVILPGREIDGNIIAAFDIMLEFAECLAVHSKGENAVSLQFCLKPDINTMQEVKVVSVMQGEEQKAITYAEEYISSLGNKDIQDGNYPLWIFHIQSKKQMKMLNTELDHSFAIIKKRKVFFYK